MLFRSRTYYAEDYNDFIESSEFIALIDLIAFQAQSLAFRTDLNARENFLETAERKDSVLRLVKQLNYTPNRNKSANGLLKIQSINTSENIFDFTKITKDIFMELQIIALYCFTDNFLKSIRFYDDPQVLMSTSEIITSVLVIG